VGDALSNQRPPPCKRQHRLSQVFTAVQKLLQICAFFSCERPVRSLMFEWVVVKPSSISPDKSLPKRPPWLSSQVESKPSFEQTWMSTIAVLALFLLTTRISIRHHYISLLGICRIIGLGERINLPSGCLCSPAAHGFPRRPLLGNRKNKPLLDTRSLVAWHHTLDTRRSSREE
jgi:hypothetical protein